MGLSWLGELFGFLGSLIPQIHHFECTDVGVTVTRGSSVRVLKPGMVLYWPFWTTLYFRPANIQTVDLPAKAIGTKDSQTVVAGGVVRYRVQDAKKALIDTEDVSEAIVDEALAAVCSFVAEHTLEEVQQSRKLANQELTRSVRIALSRYGVRVERAQLTDFAPCIVLKHLGIQ